MHSTDQIRQARAFLTAAVGPNPSPRNVRQIQDLGPAAAEAILAGEITDLGSETAPRPDRELPMAGFGLSHLTTPCPTQWWDKKVPVDKGMQGGPHI